MNAQKAAMLAALKKAYGGEAIFRPSNAARWMTCHGSIQLIARLPPEIRKGKTSDAAREGTAAHALAETILNSRTSPTGRQAPEEYVGRTMMADGVPTLVDEEMAEKTTEYVQLIDSYLATPGSQLFVERKLTLAHLDPTNPLLAECRGTGDAIVYNPIARWIVLNDLKYGKGIPVDGDSPQLKIYAMMILIEFQQPGVAWEWAGTTVFQPRLPMPRFSENDLIKAFSFKPAELLGPFLGEVYQAMDAALEPDPKFKPSAKACQWCPARQGNFCAALQQEAIAIGYDPFDIRLQQAMTIGAVPDFAMPEADRYARARQIETAPPDVVVLPEIEGMDVAQLSAILRGEALLSMWLSGVKHRATQLLKLGIEVPGFSLKRRAGHRKWAVTPAQIEAALQQAGVFPGSMYGKPKMLSPAQMEKLVPSTLKGMFQPDFGLVEIPQGEYELVAKSGNALEGPGEVELY